MDVITKRRKVKRARISAPEWDLLGLIAGLSQQDLGLHIAVRVLRYAGTQSLVCSCKATLNWSSCDGRRLCFCVNDECRGIAGPFAPLSRLVPSHVEIIRLGRYGRTSIEDSVDVIATCARASILRSVYSKLAGVGLALESRLSGSTLPYLRRLRFHQCRLSAEDAATFFSLTPQLEQADFCGESLQGLGKCLRTRSCKCPLLHKAEFTDCSLQAADVAILLTMFGDSLRTCYLQSNQLRGLRIPHLPLLEDLGLQDCCLVRADAVAIMANCSALVNLALCGNRLAEDDASDDDDSEVSDGSSGTRSRNDNWPQMPQLRHADFRACGLSPGSVETLRRCFPEGAALNVAAINSCPSSLAIGTSSHIIFDSSEEDS